MHPSSYRGCWHEVSRCLFLGYRHRTGISSRPYSSPRKGVYNPKAFIPHAALLDQAFAHCPKFPTAASRRSQDRVSVPMCPITLSRRIPVVGLVSCYLTNYLIGREPLLRRSNTVSSPSLKIVSIWGITSPFGLLSPSEGQVTHVLLTRSPLSQGASTLFSLDLHV